jgi:hypothetical protein
MFTLIDILQHICIFKNPLYIYIYLFIYVYLYLLVFIADFIVYISTF